MPCELLKLMQPVTIAQKPLFDGYFARHPQQVCEMTFADIFCRVELKHHLWCEYKGHLLVSFRDEDGCLNIFPPVGPDPVPLIEESFAGLCRYHWVRLHQSLADTLGKNHELEFDRNNSDYIYKLEDLKVMRGKKFDGKRNFVKRFAAQEPVVRALTSADAMACIRVQEMWLEGQQNNVSARNESSAFIKGMQHYDALGLHGIGVWLESELVSFAVGEPLNGDTFIEHFEKALPGHTGLYPFTTHAFVNSLPSQYVWLNREQDLGIEGLRKAKESWNPDHLEKKYSLRVHCKNAPPPTEITV